MSEHPRYHERQVLLVRHGQTALNGAGRAPRPAGPATVRCELPRSAGSGSSLPNANAGPWLRSTWPWTPPPPQGRCSATCCSPWPGSRNASSGNAPATPSPSRRPPGSGSADPPRPAPPDIVDRILQQRRAGHSYPHIATQLNNEQVPTAHGGSRWWPATIASVHHSHSEIAPHDPAATYAPTLVGRLTYAIGRRLGSHQTAATSSTALSMSKHAKPAAELK